MSLSTPTTSMPRPAKCRTDSDPIRPADPVTTTTLLITTSGEKENGPRLQGGGPSDRLWVVGGAVGWASSRASGRRVTVAMLGPRAKWARHLFGTSNGEAPAVGQ